MTLSGKPASKGGFAAPQFLEGHLEEVDDDVGTGEALLDVVSNSSFCVQHGRRFSYGGERRPLQQAKPQVERITLHVVAKKETLAPNCMRCGGTRFVDVPMRAPNDLTVLSLLCCQECMGVVAAYRSLNPVAWATTPKAHLEWVAGPEPPKAKRSKGK